MKRPITRILSAAIAFCVATQPAQAALLTLATQPIYLGAAIPPQVMINMTKDQQLYKKAYNDYSDLDGDGALETTYKHSIGYYGYFDSFKCYDYSTSNNRFEPASVTADKYCSGNWSGNFLNWATMTRMDAVRKLLYGGLRSTDTATVTVLQRTYLPTDAHAFAKYYDGDDIARLTPFTVNFFPPLALSTSTHTVSLGSKTFNITSTGFQVGHQIRAWATAGTAIGEVLIGTVTAVTGTSITAFIDSFSGGAGTSGNNWDVENMTKVGITFCNATLGGTGTNGTGSIGSPQDKSQTNTNPPLMRVVNGNYALWGAAERFQCYFQSETTAPVRGTNMLAPLGTSANLPVRSNGNRAGLSGLYSAYFEPVTGDGLGSTSYVVRALACVSTLLGTEKCREYNTNNAFKPIGLLQVYGDPGLIHFGLMTGSYSKNISGGVLRKNVGVFTNEVAADGTFLVPAGGGIVDALNRFRIYGYNYGDGTYGGAAGDNCSFQLTNITEGNCRSWGNPMAESYFESLRYFAGATTATGVFSTTNDSTLISGLSTATWPASSTTVLSNSNYCAPLNVVVFNSSVSTNEDDNQIPTSLSTVINSTQTAAQLTTTVGNNEPGSDAVTGTNKFFYGKTPTLASSDPGFELCTAKDAPAGGLGDVVGICPEGPTLGGTYHMAGLAYHAKINRIRTDITAVPAGDTKSLKVTTYGVNLSTNVPTLPVKVLGDTNPRAIIQPIYRLVRTAAPAGIGGGALVDLKIVSQSVTATSSSGSFYLNWEDSEQGGDYDQDLWGLLSYCMQVNGDTTSCPQNGGLTDTISVTTDAIAESTNQQQGFGYVVSGTDKDGPHFHSGIEDFNFTETQTIAVYNAAGTQINGTGNITANGGCTSCDLGDGATTALYRLSTSGTGRNLKDPLYYAAKFGGFKDSNSNDVPDLTSEWDILLSDGTTGSDGNPDNYFLVSNPLGLEASLNKVFLTILLTSSASSVATNSTSLQAGTKLYQARFNSNDWSGQVLAFPVNSDGSVSTTPDLDAGELMNPTLTPSFSPDNRVIITFTKGVVGSPPRGVAFRWPTNPAAPATSDITSAMVTALKTNPSSAAVETNLKGSQRLLYLRGHSVDVSTDPDTVLEGTGAGDFRRRPTSKLGDIVNSNPNFVGSPNAGHGDSAYASFRLAHISRVPVVYAASNDGMLHGFNAGNGIDKGKEVLAFMPSKAVLKANKLTSQTYQHEYFVDGSPEVQDVCTTAHGASDVCGGWATYLAGTLGAGGHGAFLLDVTSPGTFAESIASSIVKWEFTDADDPDLGNSMGTPLIRRMANGKWAVILTGGYNNSASDGAASTTGHGVIFILFASGPTGANGTWVAGTDYIKLTTATGTVATPNGLAQPFSADINTDGIIDFLYAGDLLGNMWKFDVRSTTASTWTNAASRVVLFQARDASNNVQPITAAAEGTSHVSGSGFMINFGTGKYLENTDVTPPGPAYLTQSYYGIWDKNDGATVSLQTTATRSELMQQQVLVNVSTSAGNARVISNNQPNWSDTSSPPLHKGWYLDFPANTPPSLTPTTGERAVFQPAVINGRLIFTTLVPSTATCSSGGQSFLMVLDNMTGGRFTQSPFDTTGDGTINSSDLVTVAGIGTVAVSGVATGIGSTGGIAGTPTVIKAGTGVGGTVSTSGQYAGGTTGSVATMGISSYWEAYLSLSSASVANVLLDLGSNSLGRLSWREITAD